MLINPIWFYLAHVCETIKIICLSVAVAFAIILFTYFVEVEKINKKCVIALVISLLGFVFFPTESVCTKMIIASQVNTENAEKAKEIIDYLIEKVK